MEQKAEIGKWRSTAIVVNNMVGAGIYSLPATLAVYGSISLMGWLFSIVSALIIAQLFSRLSKMVPGELGGPYQYTYKAFGKAPGFLVAWSYWSSIWSGILAFTIAFVGYLTVMLPQWEGNSLISTIICLVLIWGLTIVNFFGAKKVGALALITSVIKLAPLFIIALGGIAILNIDQFTPFNALEMPEWKAMFVTASLTFFSFLGIESATVTAEKVTHADKNVSFATIWGTAISAALYLLVTIGVMGVLPGNVLQNANAPIADAAGVIFGGNWNWVVALAAMITLFGSINGWTMLQAQVPQAIARDGLFPSFFAMENKYKVPVWGLIISALINTALVIFNNSKPALEIFELMILVSTITVMLPYIFCAAAFPILMKSKNLRITPLHYLLSIGTALVSILIIVGSGWESIIWGSVFLLLGLPFYLISRRKAG